MRKLVVLIALGLMLLPALAAQNEKPAAVRALKAGKELLRRDEFAAAIGVLKVYADMEPDKSLGYDLLACTYLKMDSLTPAAKNIVLSQHLDPDEQTGYFANWLQGIVLLREGDATGAESTLARAAKGSPTIAGQRTARARQNTDSLFVGEGATEQSSEEYRLKLADLILDECIDHALFGEQPKQE